MPQKYPRKPIGNFFIKKDLQVRLIIKIVLSVLLATGVFASTLLITYKALYKDAAFYQITLGGRDPQIGGRLEIVSILLPSTIVSSVVNILLAVAIGLYASRKYAVPVFKLEKWASLLAAGKLTAVLRFREKDEMKDLSDRCNESVLKIRTDLLTIKRGLEAIRQNPDSDQIGSILEIIGRMELDPDIIEIKTASIEYSKAKSR